MCWSHLASAGPCDLVHRGTEPSEVKVAGKPIPIDPNTWQAISDCSNVEVIRGRVLMRGLAGGIPVKAECEKGPCSLPPDSKSLVVSSTSSYRLAPGGHRMDKDVARKAGMPKGQIYSIDTAANFDFSSLPGSVAAFSLSEAKGKKPVFSAPVTAGQLRIPDGTLKRGTKYAWDVYGTGNKKLASGGFDLLTDDEAKPVAESLAKLEQNGQRSITEKLFDELAVFYSHDLTYEIDLLRRTLGAPQ